MSLFNDDEEGGYPKYCCEYHHVEHEILDTFGLTIQELREIYKSTDISDMSLLVKEWSRSGFIKLYPEQLHRPDLDWDGRTIFDLFNESKMDKDRILFAGHRLNMIRDYRKKYQGIDPFFEPSDDGF